MNVRFRAALMQQNEWHPLPGNFRGSSRQDWTKTNLLFSPTINDRPTCLLKHLWCTPNIALNVGGQNKIVTFFLHRFFIVSANHPALLHVLRLTLAHGIWIAAVHEHGSPYFTYKVNLLKCYSLTFRVGVRLTKNYISRVCHIFFCGTAARHVPSAGQYLNLNTY